MSEPTLDRRQYDNEILTEVRVLESKFDRHLEIYAANGKESKRVADALSAMQHGIERMLENSNECGAKVALMFAKHMDEVAVSKADAARLKKIVLWGSVIVAGGAILAFARAVLVP